MMNLYALQTEIDGKDVTMLTLLDAHTISEVKNRNAIVGILKDPSGKVIHQNIIYNPDFVSFFHKTMLVFAELGQPMGSHDENGFMYVVDERSKAPEKPDPCDIIGSFEVKAGVVLKDTYAPNARYEFISEQGLFRLPAQIERVLFMALV